MREAIANWREVERRTLVDAMTATTVSDLDRYVLRLDAAVRDVALAAVRMMPDERGFIGGDENNLGEFVDDAASRRVIAEIVRQFGLPEGSEGGKE